MAYSEEVVLRARERLAQAKADREAENREHMEYAYKMVPRIREIDRLLRVSMATAAQRIFSSGNTHEACALLESFRSKLRYLQKLPAICKAPVLLPVGYDIFCQGLADTGNILH